MKKKDELDKKSVFLLRASWRENAVYEVKREKEKKNLIISHI